MTNVLPMLLGAALVAIGVLAAALADRIRGIRLTREAPSRERTGRGTASVPAQPIRVVEPASLLQPQVPKQRAPRAEPKSDTKLRSEVNDAEDVIAALMNANYKRAIASEATWSCTQAERGTIEDWLRAALRRCAQGGMS